MALDTAAAVAKLSSLRHKFTLKVKATKPFYPRIATVIPSDGADEEYGMLGSVPGVREWLGDRQFHTPRAARFTIENKLWESSIAVQKTHINDDRLGLYGPMFEQLAVRAARHPDKLLLGDLMVNATAATSLALDGQIFFDTDHAWGDSGSQDNDLTQNINVASAPTLDEFRTSVSLAIQAMMAFKDDKGEYLHDDVIMRAGEGMELLAVVPANMLDVATKAFMPGILVGNGETNVPIATAEVIATPHYGAAGVYWDLYRLDTPIKPFIFQQREPLKTAMKGMDDIEWKDVKFMTEARYNLGYGAWWNAVRTTFT